jgi:hypothetical protein
MTPRQAIVDALAMVPGLTAKPTVSGPISPGDAWPVWRSTVWANPVPGGPRFGAWFVYVALPGGAPDVTVAEADPLVELIGDALWLVPVRVVTVEPYAWPVAEGVTTPVLRYTVDDQ